MNLNTSKHKLYVLRYFKVEPRGVKSNYFGEDLYKIDV